MLTVTNESSGDDVVVTVASPGDPTTTCTTATRPTRIDLTAGTVAGQPCSQLDVAAEMEPPYTVQYENGSNATGTYALTLVNRTAMPAGRYAVDGWPQTRPLVIRTTVGIRYRDADVEYETTRGVELEA